MLEATHTQNLEAERAVLGALLLKGSIPAGLDLDPFDFTSHQHRAIYRAMQAVEKLDAILVVAELNRTGNLDEAGGQAALHALAGSVPALGHLREYTQELKRCRRWRLRRSAVARMLDAAERGDEELWARGEAWIKGEPTNVIDLASRRAS
jgi:replicative DNA helicase